MIFIDIKDVAHARGVTDAAGIYTAVVSHRLTRSAQHTEQSEFAGQLNLVVGNVANLSQSLAN